MLVSANMHLCELVLLCVCMSVSVCMNVSLTRAAISHPGEAPQALLAGPWSPSMGSSQPRDIQTAWNVNSKT